MPKEKTKMVRVTLYLPDDLIKRLKTQATQLDVTFSAYVRMLLVEKAEEFKSQS